MDAEEQEQLERLRAVVARYWKPAALIAIVLIAAVGGLYYRRAAGEARQLAAAEALAKLRTAALDDDIGAARAAYREIERSGSDSYRDLGGFALAAFLFAEGEWDGAAAALDGIIQDSDDDGFRRIARLRRAQIDIDAGRPDEALALLDENPPQSPRLRILYDEAAGDALAAKGDLAAARTRYQEALQAAAAENATHQAALQAKLAALNSRPQTDGGSPADETAAPDDESQTAADASNRATSGENGGEDGESGEGADETTDAASDAGDNPTEAADGENAVEAAQN